MSDPQTIPTNVLPVDDSVNPEIGLSNTQENPTNENSDDPEIPNEDSDNLDKWGFGEGNKLEYSQRKFLYWRKGETKVSSHS